MTLARRRQMMTKEQVEEYTDYSNLVITGAVRRGELKAERPGRSPRSRLYFEKTEVDRWLETLSEGSA